MEADIQSSPAHDHRHVEDAPANQAPPFLHHHHHHPCHHHPPFPHVLQGPHQPHPFPPPFLCSRCKCWNFPLNPSFHSHPHHDHFLHPHPFPHISPIPHHHHPVPYPLPAQTAEYFQDQIHPEVTANVNYQGENVPSDSCGADNMGDDEEEYEFVMTDEWMEFFAKSEARRQEKKRQQKQAARDLRKATRARCQTEGTSHEVNE